MTIERNNNQREGYTLRAQSYPTPYGEPYGDLSSPVYSGFAFPDDNTTLYQQAQYSPFNAINGQEFYSASLISHSAPYLEQLQDYDMPFPAAQKMLHGQALRKDISGHGNHTNKTASFPSNTRQVSVEWQQQPFPERSPKRQRIRDASYSRTPQISYKQPGTSIILGDCDAESVASSECCSSCSSGVLCDEPDCEAQKVVVIPCDKQSCDEFICHCSEPGKFSNFQNGNLENCKSCWVPASPTPDNREFEVPPVLRIRQHVSTTSTGPQLSSARINTVAPSIVKQRSRTKKLLSRDQSQDTNRTGLSTTIVSGVGSHFEESSTIWSRPNTYNTTFNCGWSECNEPFYSEEELGTHVHQKHIDPQLLIRCPGPACKEKMSPEPLQNHLEATHGFNFDDGNTCPAPDCPSETLLNPTDYHNHLHKAHTDPAAPPLQCGWASCGDQFLDEFQFWNHLPDHYNYTNFAPNLPQYPTTILDEGSQESKTLKPPPSSSFAGHVCMWKEQAGNKCAMTFENEAALQQHLLESHIKHLEKEDCGYMCRWEGCVRHEKNREKAGFGQRSKIERHMYTHTGYKPDTCEICGLSFSGKQAKAQHIRSAHTNETPFQCKYCPKKFPQQSACLMHERTHTGEKPLACNICGQRFGESSNLTKHRKAHGTPGSYRCTFPGCKKDFFVEVDGLRAHMREMHGFAAEDEKMDVEMEGNGRVGDD